MQGLTEGTWTSRIPIHWFFEDGIKIRDQSQADRSLEAAISFPFPCWRWASDVDIQFPCCGLYGPDQTRAYRNHRQLDGVHYNCL